MWRTVTGLLAVAAATALIAIVATADRGESPPAAVARSAASLSPAPTAEVAQSVPAPSGRVLEEMNRRQGTPRRVARSAARSERRLRRIEARIRARERAAAARRRQAAAARARALPRPGGLPYWFDAEAAAHTMRRPMSAAESAWINSGRGAWVDANGLARPPANAPEPIKRVIAAGNMIARSPYKWGGGHGAWRDKGYDCSGSVSYALAAGGMLGYSQTSGQLMSWGAPGRGRWLTIYAHDGHVFMYVAGLRFDTSGRRGDRASRWQLAPRSVAGFAARHYPGL